LSNEILGNFGDISVRKGLLLVIQSGLY